MGLPVRTARLTVRAFKRADLPAFAAYRSDPAVARYQGWDAPYTDADAQAFWAEQEDLAFNTDGTWFQLAAERAEDGVLVGDVAVHAFDAGRSAELGMTLAPAHQGQGYATEMVAGVLALLFETLGKDRVIARTDARNAPAVAVLERLGFALEARERVRFKGAWCAELQYALRAKTWSPPA